MLDDLGPLDSVLDIGCMDTPTATWGTFSRRYAVDRWRLPNLPGVVGIQGEWPKCRVSLPVNFDVVACLQVLEHIQDVVPFTQAIFDVATKAVILSVPYKWSTDATPYHVHDPVDEAKLRSWTNRNPDEIRITERKRLVALYVINHDVGGSIL